MLKLEEIEHLEYLLETIEKPIHSKKALLKIQNDYDIPFEAMYSIYEHRKSTNNNQIHCIQAIEDWIYLFDIFKIAGGNICELKA